MKNENPKKFSLSFKENNNNHFPQCFLPTSSEKSRLMAFNDKYLAYFGEYPYKIKIVDSTQPKKLLRELPSNLLERLDVWDIKFSPFNNEILSYSSGKKVYLYNLGEKKENDNNLKAGLYNRHSNRVNFINFNPVA